MRIERLDHLVLTVRDIDRTIEFYCDALGMESVIFAQARCALSFGQQKINLHQTGKELLPHAGHSLPGSADLCLITMTPLRQAIKHLAALGTKIEEGRLQKPGRWVQSNTSISATQTTI